VDLYVDAVDPALDAPVDPSVRRAVAAAARALVTNLERSSRTGYVRVSAEADHVAGGLIGQAVRPLAAVVVRPGTPSVVTVGLNARSADAVLEILRRLAG
jgi:hypothetical protein